MACAIYLIRDFATVRVFTRASCRQRRLPENGSTYNDIRDVLGSVDKGEELADLILIRTGPAVAPANLRSVAIRIPLRSVNLSDRYNASNWRIMTRPGLGVLQCGRRL
jgi:hypothetical protein